MTDTFPFWVFSKNIRKTYYPFSGCEFVIPKKFKPKKKPLRFVCDKNHLFVGMHCESLKKEGFLKVLYSESFGGVQKCLFEYVEPTKGEKVFVFTLYAPSHLWYDKQVLCEVYFSTNINDLQRAFLFTLSTTNV